MLNFYFGLRHNIDKSSDSSETNTFKVNNLAKFDPTVLFMPFEHYRQ